jgi:peptide/nickel transport system permease protein
MMKEKDLKLEKNVPGKQNEEKPDNHIKSNISHMIRVFFGRGWISGISSGIIAVFIIVAFIAPLLAPYDPNVQNLQDALGKPSAAHILGTDHFGRDVMSRIIYGSRVSLYASVLSGLFAAAIGILLGLLAGYFGGFVGQVIMRFTDALLSIPGIVFTLVLASVMGKGLFSIVIAIGIGMIPTYIRMMNGLVLSLKENDFVTASTLIGQKNSVILFKHLLPNCFPSLIVLFTINLGSSIMLEASLSFLGVGIVPPTATWGGMVSDGYSYLTINPLLSLLPGICIILVVMAFNIVGDGLRDALDPRLRGKL